MEPSKKKLVVLTVSVLLLAAVVIGAGIYVGGRFIREQQAQQATARREKEEEAARRKAQQEEAARAQAEQERIEQERQASEEAARAQAEAQQAASRAQAERVKAAAATVALANVSAYATANLGILPEENYDESKILVTPTPEGGGRKIAIDAGHQAHGNSEKEPIGPGASETKAKVASGTHGNTSGLDEYELNLTVSLQLRDELQRRGYEVYMIRESHDVNISNAERAQMAAQSGSDILVRIHANGDNDTSVHGALTMAPGSDNPYLSPELISASRDLSRKLIEHIIGATGARDLGVQYYNNMSGINWSTLPVSIVEMGFMSNPEEDALMASADYQAKIVRGIADGIDAYYAQ